MGKYLNHLELFVIIDYFISDPPQKVFLRADFKDIILVQGIALQGTSPKAHFATKQFTITYKFNDLTVDYNDNQVIH